MKFYYERERGGSSWGAEQQHVKTETTQEAIEILTKRHSDLLVIYDEDFNVVWESAPQATKENA